MPDPFTGLTSVPVRDDPEKSRQSLSLALVIAACIGSGYCLPGFRQAGHNEAYKN